MLEAASRPPAFCNLSLPLPCVMLVAVAAPASAGGGEEGRAGAFSPTPSMRFKAAIIYETQKNTRKCNRTRDTYGAFVGTKTKKLNERETRMKGRKEELKRSYAHNICRQRGACGHGGVAPPSYDAHKQDRTSAGDDGKPSGGAAANWFHNTPRAAAVAALRAV